jgi:hypothetical protein
MPKVPWNLLLNQLPTLLRAVDTLIDTTAKRNAVRDTAPALETLHKRMAAAEEQQQLSADLLKQLAENINTVAQGAEESAATLRRMEIVTWTALGLALLACVIAIVAWVRG